jgi:hypothetical protein
MRAAIVACNVVGTKVPTVAHPSLVGIGVDPHIGVTDAAAAAMQQPASPSGAVAPVSSPRAGRDHSAPSLVRFHGGGSANGL